MTLYIKSKDDSKIILTIVKHKGFVQMIELLNFCLNSDLKPIMHYFNQNLKGDIENQEINEVLF